MTLPEETCTSNEEVKRTSPERSHSNTRCPVPLVCVVPGCTVDVSGGPRYLRRHKLCLEHLKARAVLIDGQEVRFCQQCGRFQPLADFKDDRRSCEAALQAHNARRRVKKNASPDGRPRRGRATKRPLIDTAEDPSSSEEATAGIMRKASARKSSSQRSAPSNLQQSAAGSGSLLAVAALGADKLHYSDGAHSVEQGAWHSGSPGNSHGSTEGGEFHQQSFMQFAALPGAGMFCIGSDGSGGSPSAMDCNQQQRQQLLLQHQASIVGNFQEPGSQAQSALLSARQGGNSSILSAGKSRLSVRSGSSGAPVGSVSFGSPQQALMQQQLLQGGALLGTAVVAAQSSQQIATNPGLACAPYLPPPATQAGSLAAWLVPPSTLQQQQAQLQQCWGAAGQLGQQDYVQAQQTLLLQPTLQEQLQPWMLAPTQQQQQQLLQPSAALQQQHTLPALQQQLQSSSMLADTLQPVQPALPFSSAGEAAAVLSAGASHTSDVSMGAAAPAAAPGSDLLPTPAAAATAASSDQVQTSLSTPPGCNSSSSPNLFDGLVAASGGPPPRVGLSSNKEDLGEEDLDALLEQALDVLLASAPDWKMDEMLFGTKQPQSGTDSGFAHTAAVTTSNPSSSNINAAENLSGPLSVPSLPSATAAAAAAGAGTGASSGMPTAQPAAAAAAATGLVGVTGALQVSSMPMDTSNLLTGPVGDTGNMHAAGMDAPSSMLAPASAMAQGGAPAGIAQAPGRLLAAGGYPPASSLAAGALPPGPLDMSISMPMSVCMPMSMAAISSACVQWPPAAAVASADDLMGMPSGGAGHPSRYEQSVSALHAAGDAAFAGDSMQLGPACGPVVATAVPVMAPGAVAPAALLQGPHAAGAAASAPMEPHCGLQQMPGWSGLPGDVSQKTAWQQQQLMGQQQQQQAEHLRQQQQQQQQRFQHLLQLQQQIDSRTHFSQQMVRLSLKLHGVTPDRLSSTTLLAMERLLSNNADDIELILLQPSVRQGCVQLEFDVLVRIPRQQTKQHEHCARAAATAARNQGSFASTSGSMQSVQQDVASTTMTAVVAALNSSVAQAAAEAQLRAALPFAVIVSTLLGLPLLHDPAGCRSAAAEASSAGPLPHSNTLSTISSCAQSICAQLGNCLGVWEAGSGLLQDWSPQLPQDGSSATEPAAAAAPAPAAAGVLVRDRHDSGSSWRPSVVTCLPLVTAAPEASPANSPTAVGSAGAVSQAGMLKPLHLKLRLQAASSSGDNSGDTLQLWCMQRGQFLPLVKRATSAGRQQQQQEEWDVLIGLEDTAPGLLLLQAEQEVPLSRGCTSNVSSSDTDQASVNGVALVQQQQQQLGAMSALVPVLLCPSAAMAAELSAHMQVTQDHSSAGDRLIQLGLVLDFWALHQQQQQQQGARQPQQEWYGALLRNTRYLQAIRALGTQLLLDAVIGGMSATAVHLQAIMTVVQSLHRPLLATATTTTSSAAVAAAAGGAEVMLGDEINATQQRAAAGASAADAPRGGTTSRPAAAVVSSSGEGELPLEGSSAAAAAGCRPVEQWVFEDVECKPQQAPGSNSCSAPSASSIDSFGEQSDAKLHNSKQRAASSSMGSTGGAELLPDPGDSLASQSSTAVLRAAMQMLATLLAMYLLLQVVVGIYRGQSSRQQLWASVVQLRHMLGVILMPLGMMAVGGLLAVLQFYVAGTQQPQQQEHHAAGYMGVATGAAAAPVASGKRGLSSPAPGASSRSTPSIPAAAAAHLCE